MSLFDAVIANVLQPFAAWLAVKRHVSCWRVLQQAIGITGAVVAGQLASAMLSGRIPGSATVPVWGLLGIGAWSIAGSGRIAKRHEMATRLFVGPMHGASRTFLGMMFKVAILAVGLTILYGSVGATLQIGAILPKLIAGGLAEKTHETLLTIACLPMEVAFSMLILAIGPMLQFCAVPPVAPPAQRQTEQSVA